MAAFIARDEAFAQTPFAFLDSSAESARTKQQPIIAWEMLLLGLLKSMRRYNLLQTPASQKMARVIDEEIIDHFFIEVPVKRIEIWKLILSG